MMRGTKLQINKVASIAIMVGGAYINATALLVEAISQGNFEWRPE